MPVGIDFGTTNSALAVARPGGEARLATFSDGERESTTFRSILYFDPRGRALGGRAEAVSGPRAIRRYVEAEQKGRLVQSVKSFLASRSFTETQIYTHTYTLEALVAEMLKRLVAEAAERLGALDGPVVLGRPVRFAGADDDEDDAFAVGRLRAAAAAAGLPDVTFELEPVAAAFEYARRLDRDELVLIGDFGGGTSDFTLVHLGPGHREVLGNEGVGLAGDAFDSRVVRHAVAPWLGAGGFYRSMGKRLELPVWVYQNLERWHYVSFLKNRRTIEMLKSLRAQAEAPGRIDALLHVVESDLGFAMYRAVDAAKCRLSSAEETALELYDPPVDVVERFSREDFEDWIRDDVRAIAGCVDRLLERAGVAAREVDSVFLTGGSSLVPIVRRYFARRFGEERLRGGEELTTVAKGLALRALEG
jgi:hypothetical chaperone protein